MRWQRNALNDPYPESPDSILSVGSVGYDLAHAGGLSALYDGFGGGIMASPGNGTATVVGFGASVNVGKTNNPVWVGGGYSGDQGKTGIKW